MHKGRLEAFSDGVIAIIITIMVLDLHAPKASSVESLRPLLPVALGYVLSFVFVGIYWNNHHHLLQATRHVTGGILWANLHLLFWLSLIPFGTSWIGATNFGGVPVGIYGGILLMAGVAYYVLELAIIHSPGSSDVLAEAVGRDVKGKVSILLYVVGILTSFVNPWAASGVYLVVALIWLVPDRRIERRVGKDGK